MLSLDTARAWYPFDDPVHGYDHIVRVYRIAERLAAAEGADIEIVRASALLHDIQGTGEQPDTPSTVAESPALRSDHHRSAAIFTRQVLEAEDWSEERIAAVQHCIRAHRFRDYTEHPETLEAQVLFDADKLDAIGAIGVARAIAFAVIDGQPIYAEPSPLFEQTGNLQIGEAHSAYHEYIFKLRNIKDRMYTTSGKELARQRHIVMSGFFEQLQNEYNAKS
jgi:uncharacterized protein